MDSFELNKIIGALLGAVFVVFSVSILADTIFYAPAPETPGYAIEVPEDAGQGGEEAPAAPESILPLLASADPEKGASIFKRCQACHTLDEGGANKVGPNLWSVVDHAVAAREGFSYSAALKEFSEGGNVKWTYENLDHFLTSPKGLVPGTAMAFAGLKKIDDRANLIAYLREQAANPVPLPDAAAENVDAEQAAPESEEQAPAEESAPAEDASSEEEAPTTENEAEEPASNN